MSNLTEKAIKQAFLELLNEYPLSQVSVRQIVEKCGINRNSFYYHYNGVPELIEEIVTEFFDTLIGKYPSISSIPDCCSESIRYTLNNKRALLHIWNSVNRDVFERYLMKFCEHVVGTYLGNTFDDGVSMEDRRLIVWVAKCELFGAFIDWISRGMPEGILEEVNRIFEVCQGLSKDIVNRCKSPEKK